MGGGDVDMDGEEDEEEDGETWLVSCHGAVVPRGRGGLMLIWQFC
jgi:hypothetical protein